LLSENPIGEKQIQQLRNVRSALLNLHKTLLDYQRKALERIGGRITNNYELLQLVLHDPWFGWLHRISELIVQMDEKLDLDVAEQPFESDAISLIEQARRLIEPAESGDEFQRKYFVALQDSPAVVMAHAQTIKLLANSDFRLK